MNDNQIVVRIGKETTTETQAFDKQQQNENKDPEKRSNTQNAVSTMIVQVGSKIISQGVSMYGDLTGNYLEGKRISEFIGFAGDIGTIAVGGPIGAVAVGMKWATSTINNIVNLKKTNYSINFKAERTGNSALNGNRWQR